MKSSPLRGSFLSVVLFFVGGPIPLSGGPAAPTLELCAAEGTPTDVFGKAHTPYCLSTVEVTHVRCKCVRDLFEAVFRFKCQDR